MNQASSAYSIVPSVVMGAGTITAVARHVASVRKPHKLEAKETKAEKSGESAAAAVSIVPPVVMGAGTITAVARHIASLDARCSPMPRARL
jgi:hypothetical protein